MITLVSGTNRAGSNTMRLTRLLAETYDSIGIETRVLDLADLPPEIISPLSYTDKPPEFLPFCEAVRKASGLVIITPEYNGSFPGVLKLFLDHLPFAEVIARKPVCFVGLADGQWGALRAVEQLQQVFAYRNAHLFPERVFIPHVADVFSVDGGLVDPGLEDRLLRQAGGFADFCQVIASRGRCALPAPPNLAN